MDKESLREIINLVESTIGRRLNESSVPPFSNKREAMLAIQDVMDGSMTQKNLINQLAAAKRAGTIDEKNFKLILGQLRMDAKSSGVKLEPIIDRLIDKYHSGSNVFNPNLGESVDGGWKSTFVYRKTDKKKFKVIDFKNYGSYQELFLKSDDGETDEVTLGHPMDKNGFRQTYTVNESIMENRTEDINNEITQAKLSVEKLNNLILKAKTDKSIDVKDLNYEKRNATQRITKLRRELTKLTEDFFNQPTDQLFIYRRAAAKKSASGTPIYILRTNQGGYKLSRSYQIGNTIAGYYNGRVQNISESLNEAPLAPVAPVTAPTKPAAAAPAATPVAPVEQGVDPAWKLDMIDFIGNSFQGQAKQFLYQAKKSNPKATPEQITAMVNVLIQSNQIVELFKTRFLSSIKAAL